MQKSIWDTHIGTGIKEAPCPLCGINVIQCPSKRCGLEMAHIVADKYFTGEPSPLSLYPSCVSCNNKCGEVCILDYLFNSGRGKQLEALIRSVHACFMMQNRDLEPERLFMHNVIDHLYGWERYKAGGGLQNDLEIFHIARSLHMQQLNEEILALNAQMQQKARELEALAKGLPKRRRPPIIF
jgi:hypothetical protein